MRHMCSNFLLSCHEVEAVFYFNTIFKILKVLPLTLVQLQCRFMFIFVKETIRADSARA